MPIGLHKKRNRKARKLTKVNNFLPQLFYQESTELPQDLIFTEILSRLPVKSLIRFKLVSKTWNSIISSPQFIKTHIQRTKSNPFVPSNCVFIKSSYFFHILNYAAYDRYPDDNRGEKGLIQVKNYSYSDHGINTFLIGSCNGLVSFGRVLPSSFYDYIFRVYNPVMDQCYDVVDPLGNFGRNLIYGFGFVSAEDDYKLFVGGLQRRTSQNFVYVFSLKTNKWKKIGAFDEAEFSVLRGGKGVLVNETLHWDMTQVRAFPVNKCICGFDLKNETFKYIPVPKIFVNNGNYSEFRLCEISGSLCTWAENRNGGWESWMLMQYGAWNSWMKIFKINTVLRLNNFYGFTESGKILVQTQEGSLLLADPDQNPPKDIYLAKNLGNIEAVSYIRSPLSPFLSVL